MRFYEFFAGGGMVRAGLGEAWSCLFANDFDLKKGVTYAANWGADALAIADVASLRTSDLPGIADVAWASFPCQDLSLAGVGAGLKGKRSGAFLPFWRLINALTQESRAPGVVVLENVCGALSSHQGKDFTAICKALADGGYRFGALVIDAVHFVPQSRPRLFFVAAREDRMISQRFMRPDPDAFVHTPRLVAAYERLPRRVSDKWVWWRLPAPSPREIFFADVLEPDPGETGWHTPVQTQRLLALMNPLHYQKIQKAKEAKRRIVGCAYRRTRRDGQRVEVRFDDVAGCLRTPSGGSSRQTIVIVEGEDVRSRLLTAREAARLMGLPDEYKLPQNYNDAYHLAGDGVVVPVVRFLAEHLLEPLAIFSYDRREGTAA